MTRRERGICLLCRHFFKPRHPNYPRRYSSAPNREPYILPRLVIDLDANDSQFVRQAKEEDYAVPDKPPRKQRYTPKVLRNNTEKGLQSTRPLQAFQLRSVTPPDLLQYALLGSPFAFPTDANLNLQKIFHTHKINPLDNADSKFKRLTFNFTTDKFKSLESMGFTPERQQQVAEQIQKCTSFNDLRRIVSILSSTTEGCEFLVREGSRVRRTIKNIRGMVSKNGRDKSATAINILRLHNNLILAMQSKGVDCGHSMYDAGLRYACRAFSLACVRKYLNALHGNGQRLSLMTARAVNKLAVHIRSKPALQTRHLSQDQRIQEILRLITGWEVDGAPKPGEKRQPCFGTYIDAQSALSSNKELYFRYIVSLGYLGASEALWNEWRSNIGKVSSTRPSMFEGYHRQKREETEIFALSFLMANDSKRALIALETSFDQFVETHESTKYILSDQTCQMLSEYYKSNNLDTTERLWEKLRMEISPRTPEAVSKVLGDMLLPQWLESVESKEVSFEEVVRYSLDWLEKDGKEGIAIIKEDAEEIVYFKASKSTTSD